jgi:hypothetical protein
MTRLACHLVSLVPQASLPPWARSGARELVEAFRLQSKGAIELSVKSESAYAVDSTPEAICAYDLHRLLRESLGAPSQPARRVALLLAGAYTHDIYGMMFDESFEASNLDRPVPTLQAGPPREGCAVFLSTISRERGTDEDRARQSLYTAIHELGHVFNLEHEFYERCYMVQSRRDVTYDRTFWRFTRVQRGALARGVHDPHVWPGGSEFGDRGYSADGGVRRNAGSQLPLTLWLDVPRPQFAPFEPIEMDIRLALQSGRREPIVLPDMIDPGYASFQIWIEEPDGQRRLFRSPRRYCWNGATTQIARRAPFARDISIFGQAGGYTFRRAGEHRLWAMLHTQGHAPLVSNTVTVDILDHERWDAREARLFQREPTKTLMYHRLDRHGGRAVRAMRTWLDERPRHPSAASAGYSLARALLERGQTKGAGRTRAEVDRLLGRAADSRVVSANQRRVAERLRRKL